MLDSDHKTNGPGEIFITGFWVLGISMEQSYMKMPSGINVNN